MSKAQRIIVCGNSVALVGIQTSLGLNEDCEIIGHDVPVAACELRELQPDVVIFELDAVPQELIYALSNELARPQEQPPLRLIGIDLKTNRAVLWTEHQAQGWTSQDLAKVIRHTGKTGLLEELKQGQDRNEVPGLKKDR